MSTKEDYKSVVFSGCAIEYRNVSLCDLRHFLPQYRGKANGVYQVHSDNKKKLYSKLDCDEALVSEAALHKMYSSKNTAF